MSARITVAAPPPVVLPAWAVVRPPRHAHIERVTALLDRWSTALALPTETRSDWHDAGRWHDALKDAPLPTLERSGAALGLPPEAWHGPAAADRLAAEGERRAAVLDAIRWHTVGSVAWDAVGRALYCADYLEPGRPDPDGTRRALADAFSAAPAAVFAAVVAQRVARAQVRGGSIHPHTHRLHEATR